MNVRALIIAASLAANVVFAVFYLPRVIGHDATPGPDAAHAAALEGRRTEARAKIEENRAAAQRGEFWSKLASNDLKTLVANLRAAGLSPALIRAIVSARVEALFKARMKEISGAVTDTPFWKAKALGLNSNPKFYAELDQVYRDRARMLREVLGNEFFADNSDETSPGQQRRFGNLSKGKIDLIQQINDDYAAMTSQVRAAMQGITLPEDREKLVLLEREKHADLVAALTPDELREYEMRTSNLTSRMRYALGIMDASEAEFRTLYEIQVPFLDRLFPPGGVKGGEMSRARQDAQKQIADQIATALGPQRAADFTRASDYEYQTLIRLAQSSNLPSTAATQAYDLRAATAAESRRIADDATLNNDQKLAALRTLAQNAKTQISSALGGAAASYVKSSDWLNFIESGGTVRITGDSTMFMPLPTPAPTAPKK